MEIVRVLLSARMGLLPSEQTEVCGLQRNEENQSKPPVIGLNDGPGRCFNKPPMRLIGFCIPCGDE